MEGMIEPSTESRRGWKAVYTIVERGNDKKYWIRIGTAFVNRDQSLNVRLDATPVGGQLHIRDAEPRREREQEPAWARGEALGRGDADEVIA